jgi:hypothetical protein
VELFEDIRREHGRGTGSIRARSRREAQFEQLAVNARRSSGWILGSQSTDQSTNLLAHSGSSSHSSGP